MHADNRYLQIDYSNQPFVLASAPRMIDIMTVLSFHHSVVKLYIVPWSHECRLFHRGDYAWLNIQCVALRMKRQDIESE